MQKEVQRSINDDLRVFKKSDTAARHGLLLKLRCSMGRKPLALIRQSLYHDPTKTRAHLKSTFLVGGLPVPVMIGKERKITRLKAELLRSGEIPFVERIFRDNGDGTQTPIGAYR